MEWTPIIYHFDKNLNKVEFWNLKIDGSYQQSLEDHAMVNHMKLSKDAAGSDYLFGTTQTHLRQNGPKRHTQLYFFRVKLNNGNHKIDD